jgi:hypothetical protein
MTNKIKTISLVAASALLSSTAFSQITFSGYNESTYFQQSRETNVAGANFKTLAPGKQLGNETVLTARAASKLPNGNPVSVYANFMDTDQTTGNERGFSIGVAKNVDFVYGYDRVFGSEIARTFTPFATNRMTDQTGHLAASNIVDITSDQHAIGFTGTDIGIAGTTLSLAYNPNFTTGRTSTTSSDSVANAAPNNNASGYSVGLTSGSINGFRLGFGMTKIDINTNNQQDIDSKTFAIQYAAAPFAIGIQRTKTDGTISTAAGTVGNAGNTAGLNQEDITDVISGTYAVSKELTAGLGYSTMERTRNSVASPVDTKVMTFSLAYNLGPVVLSYDHERVQDSSDVAAVTVNNIAGNDSTTNKLKARVNF